MKKFLIVYYGDVPESVEGFPKDCKRSCEGALHVKPSRQMTVTEDELKHIKTADSYKHMLPKLRELGEQVEPKKKKEEEKGSTEQEGASKKEDEEDEEPAATTEGTKPETETAKERKKREKKEKREAEKNANS